MRLPVLCCLVVVGLCPAFAHAEPGLVDRVKQAFAEHVEGRHFEYAYTDDSGRLVHVATLDDVPQALRSYARQVEIKNELDDEPTPISDILSGKLANVGNGAQANIYRYRDVGGHMVFTNVVEQVPVAQRATAGVDLSHVTLNSEVGSELDARLSDQHKKLIQSQYCLGLRAQLDEPVWLRIWHDYAPLVICGGAILLMLLVTPWMATKFYAPAWARVLMHGVPALALAGIMSYATMHTLGAVSKLQEKAKICQPQTWTAQASEPNGLVQHLNLVRQLQSQLQLVDAVQTDVR